MIEEKEMIKEKYFRDIGCQFQNWWVFEDIFINENYKIEIDTNFGLFGFLLSVLSVKIKNKKN